MPPCCGSYCNSYGRPSWLLQLPRQYLSLCHRSLPRGRSRNQNRNHQNNSRLHRQMIFPFWKDGLRWPRQYDIAMIFLKGLRGDIHNQVEKTNAQWMASMVQTITNGYFGGYIGKRQPCRKAELTKCINQMYNLRNKINDKGASAQHRAVSGRMRTDLEQFAAMMSRRKSKQQKNQNAAHSSRLFNSEIARSVVVKAVSKCR